MLSIIVALFATIPTDAAKSSLDILVMADWGGQASSPYTTKDELATAKIMGEIGSTFDVDHAWGIGDNFYTDGVTSEYDKRFQETFESVFTADSLSSIPFYMIAGNHDHHQNVTGEIMYTNHSKRWRYPDYWYNVKFSVPGTSYTFELVMIDTVTLSGISESQEYCDQVGIEDCPIQPRGAEDPIKAQSQWDWIKATLEASTASYLVVAGHYPVWSIAEHGSTSELVQKLNPMLIQYNATAYFSGHDHTFEYIDDNSGVVYVDTGGSHTCDTSTAHANTIPKNSLKFHGCNEGGFTRIRIDSNGFKVYYYYGASTSVQYQTDYIKPRM